jgi:hypothetical protein
LASQSQLPVIGWREWVALPTLGVPAVKAKVDTGARTSALHALEIEEFQRRKSTWVRFKVLPFQREDEKPLVVEAELLEYRHVRSSTGHLTRRPVIVTSIELLEQRWPIELTLTSRIEMGFRMLLGREALRGRFWIDPRRSFLSGQGPTDHERHLMNLRRRRGGRRSDSRRNRAGQAGD